MLASYFNVLLNDFTNSSEPLEDFGTVTEISLTKYAPSDCVSR